MLVRTALWPRLILAAVLLCIGTAAHAEKRVALVIGNSAYRVATPLNNPANDATLIASTLQSVGFVVVGGAAQLDLDNTGFDAALQSFKQALVGADVALFYYAGHGVETHGLNYLVPVDANPTEAADIFIQMTGLAGILETMEKSGAGVNILLLDACRDNPFHDRSARTIKAGLAQMQAPAGTLISFATQPHGVSLDGDDGHSPYTLALAQTMREPGFGLFKTFNEVGLAVEKATGGHQLPWVSSSPIASHFYFSARPAVVTPVSLPTAPAANVPVATPNDAASRRDLVTDCDRLAAMPDDRGRASGTPGVALDKINITAASAACADAMQRYPDMMRFVFEAGRVADARKDYVETRRLYQKAADGGYPSGANNIGMTYENGHGVTRNYAEAAKWYSKAIQGGEPAAMVNLGNLYQAGHGVAQNCTEAARLYNEAIQDGVSDGYNNLGLIYFTDVCGTRDYDQARRAFEQGSAAGDASAMNNLGILYEDGHGVRRSQAAARQWFEKAAALGSPEARKNLQGLRR